MLCFQFTKHPSILCQIMDSVIRNTELVLELSEYILYVQIAYFY